MKKKINPIIFLLLSFFLTVKVQAGGITVNGTRVVYNENKKEESISVSNLDNSPYLIQSWVDKSEDDLNTIPFIVTPPLFRLEGNEENSIRIVYVGVPLPTDRESLYWLNIKAIPSSKKNDTGNYLQIAVKNVIKLIYRPKNIEGDPEKYANKLIWSKKKNYLIVKNPTPFYMNFQEITIDGQKINNFTYVAPMSEASFKVEKNKYKQVYWKVINDYGGVSPEFNQKLKDKTND